jgi:hypothetical protein
MRVMGDGSHRKSSYEGELLADLSAFFNNSAKRA